MNINFDKVKKVTSILRRVYPYEELATDIIPFLDENSFR